MKHDHQELVGELEVVVVVVVEEEREAEIEIEGVIEDTRIFVSQSWPATPDLLRGTPYANIRVLQPGEALKWSFQRPG